MSQHVARVAAMVPPPWLEFANSWTGRILATGTAACAVALVVWWTGTPVRIIGLIQVDPAGRNVEEDEQDGDEGSFKALKEPPTPAAPAPDALPDPQP